MGYRTDGMGGLPHKGEADLVKLPLWMIAGPIIGGLTGCDTHSELPPMPLALYELPGDEVPFIYPDTGYTADRRFHKGWRSWGKGFYR
jgi:hypothetical protein